VAGAEILVEKTRLIDVGREEWETLAAGFADHNYRQLWDYSHMLAGRQKARSRHIRIVRGEEVIGVADVRIRRAPLAGGIAYISGGPLVRKGDGEDVGRLKESLVALRGQLGEVEGLVIRIQGTLGDERWTGAAEECFLAEGFRRSKSGREYRTLMVDLEPDLGEIRARLAQKWRNCLNKAERAGLEVKTATGLAEFDQFVDLFDDFRSRKGFAVDLDAKFFRELQGTLRGSDALTLRYIETDGKMAAGHLSTTLGDTCVYVLGATTDESLRTNAAYRLQWHVLKEAKEKGEKWYDLGGIDPEGNPGVYHFKSGLGGVEIRAPGPFEFARPSIRSHLVLGAERVYRLLKGRRNSRSPVTPARERV
jgi:hypothetical protein